MNQRETLIRLATVITALADLKKEGIDGAPASTLYTTVCQMNYNDWTILQSALVRAGLITITSHFVRITEKGLAAAAEVDSVMNLGTQKGD